MLGTNLISMKFRFLLAICLLIAYSSAQACKCSTLNYLSIWDNSDYVANVRILNILPDPNNPEFHDLTVEITESYKGPKTTRLKLHSKLNSSCGLYLPKRTEWLIFARLNDLKQLAFEYCSLPLRIDEVFDSQIFPQGEERHRKRLETLFSHLNLLKKNRVLSTNPHQLRIIGDNSEIIKSDILGKEKDDALFEITLHRNLSVKKIKVLKAAKNPEITRRMTQLAKSIQFSPIKKSLTSESKLYFAYQYAFGIVEDYVEEMGYIGSKFY